MLSMAFVDPRGYGALVRDAFITNAVRSRLPALSLRRAKSMPNARETASMERTTSNSSLESDDTAISMDSSTAPTPSRARAETTAGHHSPETALVPYDRPLAPIRPNGVDQGAADLAYAFMCLSRQRGANQGRDEKVIRAMQLDVVKYSLLSLPQNLSEPEIATLRQSMPAMLQDPTAEKLPEYVEKEPPSTLRRIMNLSTRLILTIIMVMMPILMMMASALLKIERRIELRERMWAVCLLVVAYSGIQDADPEDVLRRIRHSPKLRQVRSLLYWVFDGVVGGALDGWDDTAQKRDEVRRRRDQQSQ